MSKEQQYPARSNGLVITDAGLAGFIVETTPELRLAVERHERRMKFIDALVNSPPGGLLLLLFPINELVLTIPNLKEAASAAAAVYVGDGVKYVEWTTRIGWIDRREISQQTALVMERNGGCVVSKADWQWARRRLKELSPECPDNVLFEQFIEDAQAWWVSRVNGPIFGHVIGLRRFQMLDRAAIARRISRLPQLAKVKIRQDFANGDLEVLETTRIHSNKTLTFSNLVTFCGYVARSRTSKDHGRKLIIEHINQAMPAAAKEGWAQVLILAATRHAIHYGGINGELWAPITIYEYTRLSLNELLHVILKAGYDDLGGAEMLKKYKQAIGSVRQSQKAKFAAFLEVFHRFLVIAGSDPLPHSLSVTGEQVPPAAAIVWPHEKERAVEFIEMFAPTRQIQLQCVSAVEIAFNIPVRTIEPWCMRLEDVASKEPFYITIYPRRNDGVGKSPAVRRQEDVFDPKLKAMLIDMVRLRREQNAGEQDVLFGAPGVFGARYEQVLCQRLINAALQWATGNPRASFYDLRHTIFSFRAESVLRGESPPSDAVELRQLSASGGHAGPDSTYAYIHILEAAIASFSRKARPISWKKVPGQEAGGETFEDVCRGVVDGCGPNIESVGWTKPTALTAKHVGLEKRAQILRLIAENLPLDSVAGSCEVPIELVHEVLADLVRGMVQVSMVKYSAASSILKQCQVVNAWALWARAANQDKYLGIKRELSRRVEGKEFKGLCLLWQNWQLCKYGDDISLINPRPAAHLVSFLLSSGTPKRSLVIESHVDAPPLAPELTRFQIEPREIRSRKGRAAHRLFLTEPGLPAREARGATLSILGLNWWMLVVGSHLIGNGEI